MLARNLQSATLTRFLFVCFFTPGSQQEEDEFEKLLNAALSEREAPSAAGGGAPYRVVKPKPSFCVKTRNVITSEKVFLNVCRTDALPEPVDVSEEQLTRILESDEPSTFRVPMSLGEGHQETDKSNGTDFFKVFFLHFL